MKKLLSAVICLSLLLGISTASFAALDEEGFSFQYGNRWGTSIEEVRASIPEEKTAEEVEDIIDCCMPLFTTPTTAKMRLMLRLPWNVYTENALSQMTRQSCWPAF